MMQSKLRFEMVMEIAKTTFIRSWNFIYKGIKSGSRLFPVKREKKRSLKKVSRLPDLMPSIKFEYLMDSTNLL